MLSFAMYTCHNPIVCSMSRMHTEREAPRTKITREDVGRQSWSEDNKQHDESLSLDSAPTVQNVAEMIKGIRLLKKNFPAAEELIAYLEDDAVWKHAVKHCRHVEGIMSLCIRLFHPSSKVSNIEEILAEADEMAFVQLCCRRLLFALTVAKHEVCMDTNTDLSAEKLMEMSDKLIEVYAEVCESYGYDPAMLSTFMKPIAYRTETSFKECNIPDINSKSLKADQGFDQLEPEEKQSLVHRFLVWMNETETLPGGKAFISKIVPRYKGYYIPSQLLSKWTSDPVAFFLEAHEYLEKNDLMYTLWRNIQNVSIICNHVPFDDKTQNELCEFLHLQDEDNKLIDLAVLMTCFFNRPDQVEKLTQFSVRYGYNSQKEDALYFHPNADKGVRPSILLPQRHEDSRPTSGKLIFTQDRPSTLGKEASFVLTPVFGKSDPVAGYVHDRGCNNNIRRYTAKRPVNGKGNDRFVHRGAVPVLTDTAFSPKSSTGCIEWGKQQKSELCKVPRVLKHPADDKTRLFQLAQPRMDKELIPEKSDVAFDFLESGHPDLAKLQQAMGTHKVTLAMKQESIPIKERTGLIKSHYLMNFMNSNQAGDSPNQFAELVGWVKSNPRAAHMPARIIELLMGCQCPPVAIPAMFTWIRVMLMISDHEHGTVLLDTLQKKAAYTILPLKDCHKDASVPTTKTQRGQKTKWQACKLGDIVKSGIATYVGCQGQFDHALKIVDQIDKLKNAAGPVTYDLGHRDFHLHHIATSFMFYEYRKTRGNNKRKRSEDSN